MRSAQGAVGADKTNRDALGFARDNIDAWEKERVAAGLDAIVINASGCGTAPRQREHLTL